MTMATEDVEPLLVRSPVFKERSTARWIACVFCLLFVLALAFIPTAQVLTIASISTERVTYRVVDRAKSAFPVGGMRVSAPGLEIDGRCVDGLLEPANGADVTYGRTGDGPIEVWVDPGIGKAPKAAVANLTDAGKPPVSFTNVYLASDKGCGTLQVPRLPIWGAARFGDEFAPANGPGRPVPRLLIKGTLKPSARSRARNVLYPLPEISIPVGSRLDAVRRCGADHACDQEAGEVSGVWWGIASGDASSVALQVEAATEARELALFRPLGSEAEIIAVYGLTQLTNDPDLIAGQFLLIAFLGLLSLAPAIARHAHDLLG